MAIAGFVLALVGLLILPIILGPLGLIFSAVGIAKKKRFGLAIAGLVISIVDIVWVLL